MARQAEAKTTAEEAEKVGSPWIKRMLRQIAASSPEGHFSREMLGAPPNHVVSESLRLIYEILQVQGLSADEGNDAIIQKAQDIVDLLRRSNQGTGAIRLMN